jgi:trans-aconitate 2-methyltransferase
VSGPDWDPAQYERFRAERAQPFGDLLELVVRWPGMRVVDLGCGTGELTARLHRELGATFTLGLDNAPAMLARSAAHSEAGLRFALGDLASFQGDEDWDLVFSSAAFQWVPDHPALLARLVAALAPGGQVAFQVPANFDAPSHRVAVEVAAEAPFAEALAQAPPAPAVLSPEDYARLLYELGCAEQHVRLQVYPHVLPSREAVVEWVKGTLLGHYRGALEPGLYALFEARYRHRLLARLPEQRPFFFPFKRLLAWGRRPRFAA